MTRDFEPQPQRAPDDGRCAQCGREIGPDEGIGSGRLGHGRFCSLDCFAEYNVEYLRKRADGSDDEPDD